MRVRLFINEHSRRGRAFAPAVRRALTDAGIDAVESVSETLEPATDAIVCAGGDGTLMRAIRIAIDARLPVGIIPLGTFNDLARTLAIPFDVEGAVRTIACGRTRTIDVATVNGFYFVNEASIGISSRVARLQTTALKQRFGMLGVAWTAMQSLRYSRPIHATVRFDGTSETLKTVQLTIANSNRFGGVFNASNAAIDDGWLDLYSVDIEGPRQAFAIARAILAGRSDDVPGLHTRRARAFDVVTRRPHHITADGEPAGMTPARFDVMPEALRVFSPQ
jgi:diacylglycerol kinase (ATP)